MRSKKLLITSNKLLKTRHRIEIKALMELLPLKDKQHNWLHFSFYKKIRENEGRKEDEKGK